MIGTALFLGKANDSWTEEALEYLGKRVDDLQVGLGDWGDPPPRVLANYSGEFIFSFLSRWVVSSQALGRVRRAALNFHPASVDYPGIGCANFALYDQAETFGVTCHHMAARVDAGPVVASQRFPIKSEDDLETLLTRTYRHLISLFKQVVAKIDAGEKLSSSNELWSRKARTWKDLRALQTLAPTLSAEEMTRRIRATSYQAYQPVLVAHGRRFVFVPDKKDGRSAGLTG